MTKREIINQLNEFPDNADVVVRNTSTNTWSNVCFLTWKNSSERVILNFKEGK